MAANSNSAPRTTGGREATPTAFAVALAHLIEVEAAWHDAPDDDGEIYRRTVAPAELAIVECRIETGADALAAMQYLIEHDFGEGSIGYDEPFGRMLTHFAIGVRDYLTDPLTAELIAAYDRDGAALYVIHTPAGYQLTRAVTDENSDAETPDADLEPDLGMTAAINQRFTSKTAGLRGAVIDGEATTGPSDREGDDGESGIVSIDPNPTFGSPVYYGMQGGRTAR